MEVLKIKDFYPRTGLRHIKISDNSGEEFYHKVLNEHFKNALDKKVKLLVDLDGVRGYSPSFIDEAFGNLVFDFQLKYVKQNLEIKSDQMPFWKESVINETFPLWESRRNGNSIPKKTANHDAWWKFIDGKFQKDIWVKSAE